MGSLTSDKSFTHKAKDYAYFFNDNAEPTMHVEGIVEVAGTSDINVDSTSLSSSGVLVGKSSSATNGDFTVAYASGTTVTFSDYPAGISGFDGDDIEFVRQIDSTGAVVETYSRDDAAMSITGDVLTVTGATFAATDTFVVGTNVLNSSASSSSASSVGGGNNTYSNASGDFTATITDATKNITITGLPFTLEAKHVVAGSIKKIDTSDDVTSLPLTNVTVSGGVITLDDAADFATGDVVVVMLVGPDKAYDVDLDNTLTTVQNPDYAHYTDVEHIIDESNLGLDGTHDGGDAATDFEDSGETYTAETVAEGYTIYNVTDGSSALIDADSLYGLAGDGGAGNPAAGDIAHAALAGGTDDDWDDADVASIPEVKRFEIPMDSYKHMSIDVLLDSQDEYNSVYVKLYATNDENADTTDDIYWKDVSTDVLGAAQLEADGIGGAARAVTQDIFFIDSSTIALKYMLKVVAECSNGTQNNEIDIRIKKGY